MKRRKSFKRRSRRGGRTRRAKRTYTIPRGGIRM